MSIAGPVARLDAPLARRNPVAKLAAGLALTLGLFATLDPVTPAIAIAGELAAVPLFGLRYRDLIRRGWPIAVAALGVLLSLVLFAADRSGPVLVSLGPLSVTGSILYTALGLALRVFAISIPGVLIFATTDPTDLADALVQNVRVPARFAIGTLAAFRLLPLLGQEWQQLRLARRARGVDAGRNPFAAARIFASMTFGLLVGAIRRGTRLASAMDARGFDSGVKRTSARIQRFRLADAALVAGAIGLAVLALAISIHQSAFIPVLAPPPQPSRPAFQGRQPCTLATAAVR
jgi:energy-coupling factor transport system permease protein